MISHEHLFKRQKRLIHLVPDVIVSAPPATEKMISSKHNKHLVYQNLIFWLIVYNPHNLQILHEGQLKTSFLKFSEYKILVDK